MITDYAAERLSGQIAKPERVLADTRPLAPAERRSLARGLIIFGTYASLYVLTFVDALSPLPLWANIFFSISNGLMISMLFIVGHDCQHGAFVPNRKWNLWLGRFAFLPCLHAGSLWRHAHNIRHHGRTNLKGSDPVWAPMSVKEYQAASPVRRLMERLYRGPLGPLIYYYAEFWPFTVAIPAAREYRGKRLRYMPDSAFVLAGFALTFVAIISVGHAFTPERPLWLVIILGWILPFAVWNYVGALSFYINHTHPGVPWFDNQSIWQAHRDAVHTTVHMRMPINVLPLYTSCMAHTAHHANPRVPVYQLEDAQEELKQRADGGVCEYTLSLREYSRIVKACKLFDFDQMCWTDFSGVPTSPRLIA
jgi:omega-6 fatty acid desaturase (delta-12 desaturase)